MKYINKIKEFLHPSKVTWLSFKETRKQTIVTLTTVAIVAVGIIAADTIIGAVLKLLV